MRLEAVITSRSASEKEMDEEAIEQAIEVAKEEFHSFIGGNQNDAAYITKRNRLSAELAYLYKVRQQIKKLARLAISD